MIDEWMVTRTQVALQLVESVFPLRNVEMFQDASDDALAALVVLMKTHVFMPGDYICRKVCWHVCEET